jgi:hypothetical protein
MNTRKTLATLIVAGSTAIAGVAQADIYVYDAYANPPRVVDVVPSQGSGYVYGPGAVYGPGFYVWDGSHYVWRNDRVSSLEDDYGRWSWVPDDFVNIPDAFPQANDKETG